MNRILKLVSAVALVTAANLASPGTTMAHGIGGTQGNWGYGMGMMGQMPMMMGPGMMGQMPMMGPGMMGQMPMMMGPGMMGQMPMMGPGMMGQMPMMGPGMMGQMPMMGPGMMGQMPMMGPGMMGQMPMMMYPGMVSALPDDLSVDQARHMLEHTLAWQGGDLKIGKVEERDADTIVAEILNPEGSPMQHIEVNRHTGRMQSVQ